MFLTLYDETFSGQQLHSLVLEINTELVTVKDLITARVLAEIECFTQKMPAKPFVVPAEADALTETSLRTIDAEKQVYVALDAFEKNGFFVLVDHVQVESLTEQVRVASDTKISFIKLTPLIGG
ncbi:hypothetical protein BWI97_22800 [Siphonobacter sp. BAB-5405]|uniref:hypothetical protein n=1 Tax=Siphonobacter sp. BAB-5405 TaxID=1864825 RepID=UPI000C8069D8|nr:hypothetical protein [Siphonobacter sp. BAB-5405]PMD90325.1 hypothetical protein BWI97_22800 [Siphonobacter sp. BAB-5405]